MNKATTRGWVIGLSATLILAGCEDGKMPEFLQPKAEVTRASSSNTSTRTVERDVEAPDVFQATDKGLWDGRPSLGGVWVAHPDATDPERVIIRNTSNQKFVVGVLYRPERQQPGPTIQVSSDAAEALGMLAGAPAELNVTALRAEKISETPAPDAEGEGEQVATVESSDIAPPSVETKALDPITAAAAAIDKADETPKPGATKPVAAATSVSTIAAGTQGGATAKPTSASKLSKPFIQIGIFSVQQNANNTAESMRRAGMVPTIKPGKMNGKEFWRVTVGPAATSAERAQLLKKIKGLGFNDAYYVTH